MRIILPKYNLSIFFIVFVCFFAYFIKHIYAQDYVTARLNIVQNGDFQSVVAPDYPANWKHSRSVLGKASYIVKSNDTNRNLGNVLFVSIRRNPVQGKHTLYQQVHLKAGTAYNLSFEASSMTGKSSVMVKIYDNTTKKNLLDSEKAFNTPSRPKEFALSFVTPSDMRSVNADLLFQFASDGKEQFLLDNVVLVPSMLDVLDTSPNQSSSPFDKLTAPNIVSSTAKEPITVPSSIPNDDFMCDLYVAGNTGSDTNTGTAVAEPFKTINKALVTLRTTPQYHVVCVQPATYKEVLAISALKGTAQSPYVIRSTSTDPVVISGDGNSLPQPSCLQDASDISASCLRMPLVAVVQSEYIILKGVHVRESSGVGLRLSNNKNITVSESKFSDNASFGILITDPSPSTVIETSELFNNFSISLSRNFDQGAGLSIYSMKKDVMIDAITLRNLKIYNNYGDGLFIGPNTSNINLSSSTFYDNTKSNISILNTQNAVLQRNLAYCSSNTSALRSKISNSSGISTGIANLLLAGNKLPFSDINLSQNLLVNNIFYNCDLNLLINTNSNQFIQNTLINNSFITNTNSEQVRISANVKPINNTFVNNLLLQKSYTSQPGFVETLLSDNVLAKNLLLTKEPVTQIVSDPLSVFQEVLETTESTDATYFDAQTLKVQKDSHVIDNGDSVEMSPKDDFFGKSRSNKPDVGAIEFAEPLVLGASITKDSSQTGIPLTECTKYVNKLGNDTTGTSLEMGYKTIQKGIQSLQNGDVLCVKGDTYNEVVTISGKFSDTTKVKIGAFGGGGAVIISPGTEKLPQANCGNLANARNNETKTDGLFKNCSKKGLVNVLNASNVELVGITILDSTATGLYVQDSSEVTLTAVNATNSGLFGAFFNNASFIVIDRSKFSENSLHRKLNSKISSSGLEMYNGSENITIKDSLFFKNYDDGVTLKGVEAVQIHDAAFWDNATTNLNIRQSKDFVVNRVLITCTSVGLANLRASLGSTTDYAVGFSYSGASKITAQQKLLVNSIVQGCKSNLVLDGAGDNYVSNLHVLNNHFINARTKGSAKENSRNVLLLGSRFSDLEFKNNIIYQNDATIRTIVGYNTKYDFTSNIIFPSTIRTLTAPAFLNTDPQLDNPENDINVSTLSISHLVPKGDSPAVNAADAHLSSDYLQVDYSKETRSNLDIGALEVKDAAYDQPQDDDTGNDDDEDSDDDNDNDNDNDTGDDNDNGDYDSCDYYWCDNTASGYDTGSDYDYSSGETPPSDDVYDPYANYYYDFDYDAGTTAQFGLVAPLDSAVLQNGSFDLSNAQNGLPTSWFIRTGVDGAVKVNQVPNDYDSTAGKALQVQLKKLPAAGRIELFQSGLPLKAGKVYALSFVAKSDYGSDVDVSLNNSIFPYEVLTSSLYGVDLKPDWNIYTGYIKIPETQNPNSNIRIVFSFDGAIDDIFLIDKVSLTEVPDETADDYAPYYNTAPVQTDAVPTNETSDYGYTADF